MKTIIGTQTDVIKELTAQVADVLARKPEANIAISAVDLPAEVLGALAASDIAFDKATLFQACEYCGAAGKSWRAGNCWTDCHFRLLRTDARSVHSW